MSHLCGWFAYCCFCCWRSRHCDSFREKCVWISRREFGYMTQSNDAERPKRWEKKVFHHSQTCWLTRPDESLLIWFCGNGSVASRWGSIWHNNLLVTQFVIESFPPFFSLHLSFFFVSFFLCLASMIKVYITKKFHLSWMVWKGPKDGKTHSKRSQLIDRSIFFSFFSAPSLFFYSLFKCAKQWHKKDEQQQKQPRLGCVNVNVKVGEFSLESPKINQSTKRGIKCLPQLDTCPHHPSFINFLFEMQHATNRNRNKQILSRETFCSSLVIHSRKFSDQCQQELLKMNFWIEEFLLVNFIYCWMMMRMNE